MSVPIFLHVMANGDIWASTNVQDTPSGTILATIKFNSDLKFQKLGTISGNSGSYAATGHTGKFGKEVS